ncbi:MAG: DUF503 domain-containing protein [bacterium]
MIVGICKLRLDLPHLHSLKEKRQLLQRIKQKGMDRFKILIAEVEDQDLWQSAVLGLALVAGDENFVRDRIQKILSFIEESEGLRIGDESIEVFHY